MRINEILSEDQELDELSLAGIGTGIKNAVGKVGTGLAKGTQTLAKGAGMVAGVPAALKTQYQAGKAATMNRLGSAAPAAPAATPPAPAASVMKAQEIASKLRSVWGQATADQGSETSSGVVQSQIKAMAKQAGMTGQTISEFHSKFLGMSI